MANITEVTTPDGLAEALQNADGGDTVEVTGDLGQVSLQDIRPDRPVTVVGGADSHFERLEMRRCANLRWSGLSFWPHDPGAGRDGSGKPRKGRSYLLTADQASENIEVSNSVFRGRKDSDNHAMWTEADWDEARVSALQLRGQGCVVRSNIAVGVNFGFVVAGRSSELFDNVVFGFSGDGLRVAESNCVVIGNQITDAIQIDGNHPDAIQIYSSTGPIQGLVIKDNLIVEWTVRPDNPLRAKLQGLGLHNGPYRDVVIRDNRIACSSYHGIRVNRTENLEITGNRVRHIDGLRGKFPRIQISNCTGNVVVANNEAELFIPDLGRTNREPNYRQAL